VEWNSRGLIEDTIRHYSWRHWGKSRRNPSADPLKSSPYLHSRYL